MQSVQHNLPCSVHCVNHIVHYGVRGRRNETTTTEQHVLMVIFSQEITLVGGCFIYVNAIFVNKIKSLATTTRPYFDGEGKTRI